MIAVRLIVLNIPVKYSVVHHIHTYIYIYIYINISSSYIALWVSFLSSTVFLPALPVSLPPLCDLLWNKTEINKESLTKLNKLKTYSKLHFESVI